jgi:hypothetical protein
MVGDKSIDSATIYRGITDDQSSAEVVDAGVGRSYSPRVTSERDDR